jgi:hypothetical protein
LINATALSGGASSPIPISKVREDPAPHPSFGGAAATIFLWPSAGKLDQPPTGIRNASR